MRDLAISSQRIVRMRQRTGPGNQYGENPMQFSIEALKPSAFYWAVDAGGICVSNPFRGSADYPNRETARSQPHRDNAR